MSASASPPKAELPLPNVPIIHRPGAEEQSPQLIRPPLTERKQLLVVDDEPAVLTLLVRVLSNDNYVIRSAPSGAAAVGLLDDPNAAAVDLLVTDLMMPEMSGRELAAIVRRRYPAVRVLYVTGFADNLFAGVQELGLGEAFMEKPFGAEGLLQATRLLMFGHISDATTPPDARDRDGKTAWDDSDNAWRAKLVRVLRRLRIG